MVVRVAEEVGLIAGDGGDQVMRGDGLAVQSAVFVCVGCQLNWLDGAGLLGKNGPEIAAVLRRGPDSWLVSARARVIEPLPLRADPKLPRVWVPGRASVRIGATLAAGTGAAARAVALAGPFARRVASATYVNGLLVFHLRSGLEVLLGDAADVRLKVGVAARALPALPSGSTSAQCAARNSALSRGRRALFFCRRSATAARLA